MILVLGILVVVNLYVFVWDKKTGVRAIKQQAEAQTGSPTMTVPTRPLDRTGDAREAPPGPVVPPPVAASHASVLDGKVGKSDTLGKLLKKNGLTAAEADEVIRALSGVLDFRTIKAGESFHLTRGADGHVTRFELELAKGHRVIAERNPSGALKASAT